jgi:hypothetical protein
MMARRRSPDSDQQRTAAGGWTLNQRLTDLRDVCRAEPASRGGRAEPAGDASTGVPTDGRGQADSCRGAAATEGPERTRAHSPRHLDAEAHERLRRYVQILLEWDEAAKRDR